MAFLTVLPYVRCSHTSLEVAGARTLPELGDEVGLVSGSYHFLFLRIRILKEKHFPQESSSLPGGRFVQGHEPSPGPASSPEALCPGRSSLSTRPVPLCLLPEAGCTAEAPWGLGASSPPLQDSHSGSYRAEPRLVPQRGSPRPGMLPQPWRPLCACLLSLPPPASAPCLSFGESPRPQLLR